MDYANGKIYTIRSFQTDKYYIGSTTQTLTKRLSKHKAYYKQGKYVSSAEIIQYGDAYIELLEDFPCFKKDQLCKREGQLIRDHKDNCVNKNIPGRTDKEYYKDNKEQRLEQMKEYRADNKEKIAERMKKYYEDNKEHRVEYQRQYRQKKDQAKLISEKEDEAGCSSAVGTILS